MANHKFILGMSIVALSFFGCQSSSDRTVFVIPSGKTEPVSGRTDDCALWIHPTDPSMSLIIGNNLVGDGGLYGWDLDGKLVFYYGPLLKPVNVDIRYNFAFGGDKIDIVVVGTHADNTLHVFQIDPHERKLVDITPSGGIPTPATYELYGLALYQNPQTRQVSAFISERKPDTPITQILLEDAGNGTVKGTVVRSFGKDDVESMVKGMYADDEMGYLYCCDQKSAVLKFYADPKNGDHLVSRFAIGDEIEGDREAIALYRCPNGEGYFLLSCLGNHDIKVYDRQEGNRFLMTVKKRGGIQTDGMEISSCPVKNYPHGFVVSHDIQSSDFVIYNWDAIASDRLKKCTCTSGY